MVPTMSSFHGPITPSLHRPVTSSPHRSTTHQREVGGGSEDRATARYARCQHEALHGRHVGVLARRGAHLPGPLSRAVRGVLRAQHSAVLLVHIQARSRVHQPDDFEESPGGLLWVAILNRHTKYKYQHFELEQLIQYDI